MPGFTWTISGSDSPTPVTAAEGWVGASDVAPTLPYDGDLALDDDGDLLIGPDGDLMITSGIDSIKSDLEARLSFWRGEWFLDASVGVPYYQQILGAKAPHLPAIEATFREVVIQTPGVESLESMSLSFNAASRQLSVTFRASTIFGPVQAAGAIEVPS